MIRFQYKQGYFVLEEGEFIDVDFDDFVLDYDCDILIDTFYDDKFVIYVATENGYSRTSVSNLLAFIEVCKYFNVSVV